MSIKINEAIADTALIAQALVRKRQNKIREGMKRGVICLDTVGGFSPYTDFPHEAPTTDLVFTDDSWKEKIEKLDEKISEVNKIPDILNSIIPDFE
ncbi:hypothetical protein [Emticicia sp. C21]|uniref:hypothetical protein n=1 Tax=Emticicia sp. C21 TaxID=2302915 RepID=UPI000E354E08|nr:hypothetical protein [Emticicia sp. C21]RFS15542.1 hypothetical protein D0T08_15440 [Emticicia sp. C21]